MFKRFITNGHEQQSPKNKILKEVLDFFNTIQIKKGVLYGYAENTSRLIFLLNDPHKGIEAKTTTGSTKNIAIELDFFKLADLLDEQFNCDSFKFLAKEKYPLLLTPQLLFSFLSSLNSSFHKNTKGLISKMETTKHMEAYVKSLNFLNPTINAQLLLQWQYEASTYSKYPYRYLDATIFIPGSKEDLADKLDEVFINEEEQFSNLLNVIEKRDSKDEHLMEEDNPFEFAF